MDVGSRHEERGQLDVAHKEDPLDRGPDGVPGLQGGPHLFGRAIIQADNRQEHDPELAPLGGGAEVVVKGGRDQGVEPGVHQRQGASLGWDERGGCGQAGGARRWGEERLGRDRLGLAGAE